VHAAFTLPRELAPLTLQNKRLIYNLLFQASAETLLGIAGDPRHLGAEIGFFGVVHRWDQHLQFHPHVHCVIAAGGLAPDYSSWISARRSFFPETGTFGPVAASINQTLIYGPVLLLLPLRHQPLSTAWLSGRKLGARLILGIVLAMLAILAYSLLRRGASYPWEVLNRIIRYQNLDKLVQVFLEDRGCPAHS
jgi:hypothetical protein